LTFLVAPFVHWWVSASHDSILSRNEASGNPGQNHTFISIPAITLPREHRASTSARSLEAPRKASHGRRAVPSKFPRGSLNVEFSVQGNDRLAHAKPERQRSRREDRGVFREGHRRRRVRVETQASTP
jgi:hypothetical protein